MVFNFSGRGRILRATPNRGNRSFSSNRGSRGFSLKGKQERSGGHPLLNNSLSAEKLRVQTNREPFFEKRLDWTNKQSFSGKPRRGLMTALFGSRTTNEKVKTEQRIESKPTIKDKSDLPKNFLDMKVKVSSKLKPEEVKYNRRKHMVTLGKDVKIDRFDFPEKLLKVVGGSKYARENTDLQNISSKERTSIRSAFRHKGTRLKKIDRDLHSGAVLRSREKSSSRKVTVGELLGKH